MTFEELQELYIRGAEVDRRLPNTARPKRLKSQSLPFTHTWEDVNGWDADDKKAREWAWLDPDQLRLTTKDVSDWELTMKLIVRVERETDRRCLLHWAKAKAGGRHFNAWCREEGIHPETGKRRKNRAILVIEASFVRNSILDSEINALSQLTDAEQMWDKTNKLAKRAWQDEETALTRDNIISGWRGIKAARNAERRAKR